MSYTYQEALEASKEYFGGEELPAKVFLDKYALRDYDNNLLEQTPNEMHVRLAKEFARIEKQKFKNPLTENEIFDLFKNFKRIIPQGSPMFGIGNPYQYVSIGNCFVIPAPYDSYLGILHTDTHITQISSRRGGVGWNMSRLRPNGMSVKNSAKTTTGMVSFMKRFSNSIREVAQLGRRGASLQCCNVHHPDVLEFIKAKRDLNEITGSNISIQFTDEFMNSVVNNEDFELKWPVSQKDADILKVKYPSVSKMISSKTIWKEFIHSAWLMAEPGAMFIDTVHRNSTCRPYGYEEEASNPCGEQFLPKFASCRLILVNLLTYVINPFTKNAKFDYDWFKKDVKLMQRLADNMVDLEIECIDKILLKIESDPEPEYIKSPAIAMWKEIKQTAINDRRTGCGYTALGDCLAALNIVYGSEESLITAENIQKEMKFAAYEATTELAQELGTFPGWCIEKDLESEFIQRIKEENIELFNKIKQYGRRNSVLLTLAPCGTVSCLTETTSGVEPVFLLEYKRRKKGNPGDAGFRVDFIDKSGDNWMEFVIYHKGLLQWMNINNNTDIKQSPYYGATANELNWINRVKLQGLLQKHIDNSISSTVNLPNDVSEQVVNNIYIEAWKNGLKGITIYRDGCRNGVLVENKQSTIDGIQHNNAPKRPKELKCDIHHIKSKGKEFFVLVGKINDSDPYEVLAGENGCLTHKTKTGTVTKLKRGQYKLVCDTGEIIESVTDLSSDDEEAITRMVSTALRHGASIDFIVHQLSKTKGHLTNFAKSLARALKTYIKDGQKICGSSCKDCGSELIYENGCEKCMNCGGSKCS